MVKKVFLLLLISVNYVFSDINIAVASNVSYTIESLIKEFNKQYPNIKINITLGSSGSLTAQIKNHAPYDIFMSANMKYPNALYEEKLAVTKPTIYAKGSLSFLTKKKLDLSKGIDLLKGENIKKIVIANPKTAPYGKASLEAIKKANLYEKIKDKLIYTQNISQTISYILAGADIAFVAKSSLYTPILTKSKNNSFEVDSKLYTPIEQGIVVLSNTREKVEAMKFYNFILGLKAKKIFENYGYLF